MARKQKQKSKPKAVKGGKKPAKTRQSGASSTPPVHDAAPAPTPTATEKKKPTMSGGIGKKTSRRMPARSGKKDPWSEEQLTTSKKSRIIDVDLVKIFANPNSWTCLDEDEKRELLSLLPAHVHPDPGPDPDDPDRKIEPLPQSFLRYSNNWRDAVRGFQFDLESGRYDTEWQAQAADAMEERALGKFDKFKEEQYEEFWGQKQKLSWDVETGDSNLVKLEELIRHDVVRAGDMWMFSRVYIKDGERILLEKEVKIISANESKGLTFAIPGGHRVFLIDDHPTIIESPAAPATPAAQPVVKKRKLRNQPATEENDQADTEPKSEVEVKSEIEPTKIENGTSTETEKQAEASVEPKPDAAQLSSTPATPVAQPVVKKRKLRNQPATEENDQADVEPKSEVEVKSEIEPTKIENGTSAETEGQAEASVEPKPDAAQPSSTSTDIPDTPIADGNADSKEDTPMTSAPQIAEDNTPSETTPQDLPIESKIPQSATSDVPIIESDVVGNNIPSDSAAAAPEAIVPQATAQDIPIIESDVVGNTRSDSAAAAPETIVPQTTSQDIPIIESDVPENTTSDATAPENNASPTKSTNGDAAVKDTNPTDPNADVILTNVFSPNTLCKKILTIDGRITNPSHGNAWKDFRCLRNNQDMGNLWEVRQAWYVRSR
ncbi:hypothetical protein FQN54_008654 [Arachnomyces sp. PD_36]|nr:hypothetical protein FQN54_008654 [Arachnomyces sp. PD_36]